MPMRRFLSVAYRAITLLGEEPYLRLCLRIGPIICPKASASASVTSRGEPGSSKTPFFGIIIMILAFPILCLKVPSVPMMLRHLPPGKLM